METERRHKNLRWLRKTTSFLWKVGSPMSTSRAHTYIIYTQTWFLLGHLHKAGNFLGTLRRRRWGKAGEGGARVASPLLPHKKQGKKKTSWNPIFWGAPIFCSWNAPSAGLGGAKVWALGARYPGVQRRARCLRGSEVVLKKTARSPDWVCMNEGGAAKNISLSMGL